MWARRKFLHQTLAGALLSLFSVSTQSESKLQSRSQTGGADPLVASSPYAIQIIYVLHGDVSWEQLRDKIENVPAIEAINSEFVSRGQILSSDFALKDGKLVANYTFDSEQSYLAWEMKMVLSKALDRRICKSIMTYEGDLSNLGTGKSGFNKQIVINVLGSGQWPKV